MRQASQSGLLAALVLALMFTGPAWGQNAPSDDQLRVQVLAAIARGQEALLRLQNRNGSWPSTYAGHEPGTTGLATLALLNSGLPPDHPAVRQALSWMKGPNADTQETYDMALIIMALAAAGDGAGTVNKFAERLEELQNLGAENRGTWGYNPNSRGGDNSNTQYAILGLHAAAMSGRPVSEEVWERAREHFLRSQIGARNVPGGAPWAYARGETGARGSMTSAGIGSLAIIRSVLPDNSNVSPDGQIDCCAPPKDEAELAIEAGVQWMARNFRIDRNPGYDLFPLYYLYGMERVGRFTGLRFIGDHDWYREGAQLLVNGQSLRDGVWVSQHETDVIGTSFALLFLSKGLSPVVINKLKYGARNDQPGNVAGQDWNRHPRDVMNLVDYTTGITGWPKLLNWQIVDLKVAADGEGVAALLQSPIQFLSGTQSPAVIQGRELELLKEYLAQGGFLLAVNNCDSREFETGFRDLVNRLFDGQFPLAKLSPTHDVYRSEYVFDPGSAPELWGVDYGCRTSVIYAGYDHACRWDKWVKHDFRRPLAAKTQIDKSMRLGVNIIAYATGRELQDKLQRPDVLLAEKDRPRDRGQLAIARLRHTGGWDTAPHALRRLKAGLETAKILTADDSPTLAASDPALFDFPLAYVHGRRNFQFTPEEQQQLKMYLENGGFLFADACCGATQFDESFRKALQEMFGRPLERIPIDHEIYQMKLGHDIRRVTRRTPSDDPAAGSMAFVTSQGEPILEGIKVGDKYAVVYSKYDLSCALERQATGACAGYPTEDALKIAVNLVLYGLVR